MMRAVALLAAGVCTAAALFLTPPGPSDPVPDLLVGSEAAAPGPARFIHCPWAWSDGSAEAVYTAAADGPASFEISFPGEEGAAPVLDGEAGPDRAARLPSPLVGTVSALVEFTEGTGSAAAAFSGGGLLAGDLCPGGLPSVWHLPGGSTLDGEKLTLRLFNPFTMDARVDLWALSEMGAEAGEALDGLAVPARKTRVVDLEMILPGREALSILVLPSAGAVIPSMILDTGADAAVWPGAGASEAWEFPIAAVEGLAAELVLTNGASLGVNFLVEVFDEAGALFDPIEGFIEGPGQARLDLGEISSSGLGLLVTGDGPFGAAVRGRSETAAAAVLGSPVNAAAWLIPGPGSVAADARIRLLNTGVTAFEVSYTFLTPSGAGRPASLELRPLSVETVEVEDARTAAVLVSGEGAFSAAWWAESEGKALFGGAVPVGR